MSRRRSGLATRSSSGPRIARGQQQARASSSPSPPIDQLGKPAERTSMGSRAANTIAIGSASSRRATNASARADASSSHWASSTTHSSGCSSATSASRLSAASPTRNRSGAGPPLSPNATSSASLLRTREAVRADRGSEHRADEGKRTRAPSRTRRRRIAGRESPGLSRSRSPAARTCLRPPRRAARRAGSRLCAPRRGGRRAPRTLRRALAGVLRGHRPAIFRFTSTRVLHRGHRGPTGRPRWLADEREMNGLHRRGHLATGRRYIQPQPCEAAPVWLAATRLATQAGVLADSTAPSIGTSSPRPTSVGREVS